MVQALKLVAVLLGLFAIVPLVVLVSTGSWKQAAEAAKGYGTVLLIVMGIPMLLGALIVLFAGGSFTS